MRLQPFCAAQIDGWDMTGVSFPCREIGGDYYDFIHRKRDSHLIVAVGDVSAKAPARRCDVVASRGRASAITTRASISEVMAEINQYIFENSAVQPNS